MLIMTFGLCITVPGPIPQVFGSMIVLGPTQMESINIQVPLQAMHGELSGRPGGDIIRV